MHSSGDAVRHVSHLSTLIREALHNHDYAQHFQQNKKYYCVVFPYENEEVIHPRLFYQERETVEVLQCDASTACHSAQWVFSHVYRQLCLVVQTFVEASQQGSAAGEVDTRAVDIGRELRR